MRNLMIGLLMLLLAPLTGAGTALAQSSYAIQRGDVLQVEVIEDTSLNRSVLVLPDGNISFPLAGSVAAAGKTVDAVAAALAAALSANFAAPPTVYVSVGQLAQPRASGPAVPRTVGIYAMGEVGKPGRIEVEPGATLLQALAQAGGFTRFAATKRVELRRTDAAGNERIYRFNYNGGGISGSTVLQAGDVIVVPERRLFE